MIRTVNGQVGDLSRAVHMPLDKMPSKRITHPHGRFKMDDICHPKCTQCCALESLWNRLEGQDALAALDLRRLRHRQAATLNGDGIAHRRGGIKPGNRNLQPQTA